MHTNLVWPEQRVDRSVNVANMPGACVNGRCRPGRRTPTISTLPTKPLPQRQYRSGSRACQQQRYLVEYPWNPLQANVSKEAVDGCFGGARGSPSVLAEKQDETALTAVASATTPVILASSARNAPSTKLHMGSGGAVHSAAQKTFRKAIRSAGPQREVKTDGKMHNQR